MKKLLIIPAYNEESNILNTCKSIKEYSKELDFIVINDGSTDDTKKILEKNKIPHINLIQNLGIGGAVQTGYMYALENNYDVAIQFDGDGQHDINSLELLLNPIEKEKADLVVGSRFKTKKSQFQSSFLRRIGIKFLSNLIYIFTNKRIYDVTSGYRASNKKVIREFVKYYPTDYPEPESLVIIAKKGYKINEVQVNMFERNGGKSSITPLKSIYYMIKVSIAIIIRVFVSKRKVVE